jgi:hypothetical protein
MTRQELLRLVEIAEILGESKQRDDQLRREPIFPAPVDRWARGNLWSAADVRRWGADLCGRRGPVASAPLADSFATFPHTLAPRRPTPRSSLSAGSPATTIGKLALATELVDLIQQAEVWRPEQ